MLDFQWNGRKWIIKKIKILFDIHSLKLKFSGAFTGDNPSSMAGLGIRKGDLGYSLGKKKKAFKYLWFL